MPATKASSASAPPSSATSMAREPMTTPSAPASSIARAWSGVEIPKPTRSGQGRPRAHALDQPGDAVRGLFAGAGRAGHRDEVDEAAGARARQLRSDRRPTSARAAGPCRGRARRTPQRARPPRRPGRRARSGRPRRPRRRRRRSGARRRPSPGWRRSSARAAPPPGPAPRRGARARAASSCRSRAPAGPARWTVGPSASGSENGIPISSRPAPPRTAASASPTRSESAIR